ncbi:tetratricopeptide repeat protein [Halomonas sp. PAMB 3264]|uniref:co-chaperone YbbN n=1 Tax=unclassified Halomonas TaxID=2609666 RepID=UPI002897A7F8|nr:MULTISPECIES: tetratricopeptide repeat protein [unclassified Halomonas]WNL39368.1 tetratricopeptide repeat protein [Halomonas sp. PAMB 3232]WNL42720.1 tetratricopeptide repeat protein [Halomonas sp. PAMB 3264]
MSIIDPRTGNTLTAEPAADTAASGSRPAVARDDVIIELSAANIQKVLEASSQVPVLLDSYSPANEPCQQLISVLEKLALEYGGAFLLAKLDAQANPEIAAQLGVRSVPDVKLVSQGGLVDGFQGALPEKEVREWLGRYIQAPEDAPATPEEQAEAALAEGDTATAREIYQTLITQYPEYHAYQVAMAKVLVAEGQRDEARSVLDNLPPEEREGAAARGVRASIEFSEQALTAEEIAALGDRDDSEARYQRALRQVADGDYDTGLEGLLTLMKSDRAYNDDAARKTLLQVFDALGADHPLTVAYRRKLFALLY